MSRGKSKFEIKDELPLRRRSVFLRYALDEDDLESHSNLDIRKTIKLKPNMETKLKNIYIFRHLDSLQFREVVHYMHEKIFAAGTEIIKKGTEHNIFYFVIKGQCCSFDPASPQQIITVYGENSYFNEGSLLYKCKSKVSIRAQTLATCILLEQSTLHKIVLLSEYKKRKCFKSLIDKMPFFNNLSLPEKLNLADSMEIKRYSKKEKIIGMNDLPYGMYFLINGSVNISVTDDFGKEFEVKELKYFGEYFGETALLSCKLVNINAVANNDIILAYLEVAAFERMFGYCQDVMNRPHEKKPEKQICEPAPISN